MLKVVTLLLMLPVLLTLKIRTHLEDAAATAEQGKQNTKLKINRTIDNQTPVSWTKHVYDKQIRFNYTGLPKSGSPSLESINWTDIHVRRQPTTPSQPMLPQSEQTPQSKPKQQEQPHAQTKPQQPTTEHKPQPNPAQAQPEHPIIRQQTVPRNITTVVDPIQHSPEKCKTHKHVFQQLRSYKVQVKPIKRPKSQALQPAYWANDPTKPKPAIMSNTANPNWTSFKYSQVQMKGILNENNSMVRQCDKDKPFWDGSQCIACPNKSYYDYEVGKCVWPDHSFGFDQNLHRFVQPRKGYRTRADAPYVDYDGRSKQEIRKLNSQTNLKQCPESAPYYDNITCVSCSMPNPLFNATSLQCSHCPNGTSYSTEWKGCFESTSQKPELSIRKSLGSILG